jgi:hypothetical protein
VKRSLQNFRRDVPYQMAHFGTTYLTAEHQWNKDELLSCIDGKFQQTIKKTFVIFEKVLPCMMSNPLFLVC